VSSAETIQFGVGFCNGYKAECYNAGMNLVEITDSQQWDEYVREHPWGHPLQLWGWGEAKRGNHWRPVRLGLHDGHEWVGAVQVLLWPIPKTGRMVAYVPRGPVVEPGTRAARELIKALEIWARNQRVLYVRLEPAWTNIRQRPNGWQKARHQIQMAQTYVINLEQDQGVLLEAMSRKHRQYVRKAERDGVVVKRLVPGELDAVFEIYDETAKRAGFGLHGREYYEHLSRMLGEAGYVYEAIYDGRPVAFLWLAAAGSTAYELYGGVTDAGQEVKANYLLKWRAISEMKAAGFIHYDFNGRVTEGVARFKEGFGPAEVDYIGTWDFPVSRLGYMAWEGLWPIAKRVGRRLAKRA
jgi:peptidoglycan pentaglycine glycine transferase (the first glycine)